LKIINNYRTTAEFIKADPYKKHLPQYQDKNNSINKD